MEGNSDSEKRKSESKQNGKTATKTKVLSLIEEAELDEVDFETLMEEIRVG